MSTRAALVMPAAGTGRRLGGVYKPFVELAGRPLLAHTLKPFLADPRVVLAVLAVPPDVLAAPPGWLAALAPRVRLVEGGTERGDSVRLALAAVPDDIDVVLVHDAARPLVTADIVDRAIRSAAAGESVITAIPATDTVQRVDADGRIVETPDRSTLWLAQTPQAFPREVVVLAYEAAREAGTTATDDAAIVLRRGVPVRVIEGDAANLKITVPADLALAEALLRARDR